MNPKNDAFLQFSRIQDRNKKTSKGKNSSFSGPL